ncbi:unnamed protein product [Choristocarpus tenellus]
MSSVGARWQGMEKIAESIEKKFPLGHMVLHKPSLLCCSVTNHIVEANVILITILPLRRGCEPETLWAFQDELVLLIAPKKRPGRSRSGKTRIEQAKDHMWELPGGILRLTKCKKTPEIGRHAVADVNITAGTEVMRAQPVGAIVLDDRRSCSGCFTFRSLTKDATTLIECPQRCGLVFCNESCLAASNHTHKWICTVMKNIPPNKKVKIDRLILRLVIKCLAQRKEGLIEDKLWERFLSLDEGTQTGSAQNILSAIKEIWKRLPPELVEGLQHDEFAMHYIRVQRNCNHLWTNPMTSKKQCLGLYPDAAVLNHSCQPNIEGHIRVIDGVPVLVMMATTDIYQGDEVNYNYLDIDVLKYPKDERRGLLQQMWGFECHCPRCKTGDIPPIPEQGGSSDATALQLLYNMEQLFFSYGHYAGERVKFRDHELELLQQGCLYIKGHHDVKSAISIKLASLVVALNATKRGLQREFSFHALVAVSTDLKNYVRFSVKAGMYWLSAATMASSLRTSTEGEQQIWNNAFTQCAQEAVENLDVCLGSDHSYVQMVKTRLQ